MAASFSKIVILDQKQMKRKRAADKKIEKNMKKALQASNKTTNLQAECALNAMEKGY